MALDAGARREVERVLDEWRRGWEALDAALATRSYAEDADFTNAFGMTRRGRGEIEGLLREVFALPFVTAGRGEVVSQELRQVATDVVTVTTRVERAGQQTPSGEPLGLRRTSHLRVLRRTDAGWQIVSHLIADAREIDRPDH